MSAHAPIDPPDRSRWSVIAAFAVLAAATQIIWLNYAPDTSFVASRLGVSESAIGWLANINTLCYVILALPAGVALDRWFKPSLTAGALICAGGALLRLAGHSYGWALAGQVIAALGQPLLLNAIPLVARNYLAEKDRAAGIAVPTAGMFAGMVSVFALGAVVPSAEWLTVGIGVGAGITCAAALAMLAALRHPVRVSASAPTGPRATIRATLRDPFIRRICLLVFFPFGTFNAITTFAQPLLEPAGVSSGVASVMLLTTVLAGVISCAFVPVLAARRGLERQVLLSGAAAAAAGCLLLAVAPSVPAGFVGLAIVGLGLLPTLPIVLELVERHTGQSEGAASGLIWLTGNLGGVVVTAATGLLTRIPAIAFLVCGCGVLLAAPLVRGLSAPVTAAETPAPNTHGAQAIKLGTRGARARRVPSDAVAYLLASVMITEYFRFMEDFPRIRRKYSMIKVLSCLGTRQTRQKERGGVPSDAANLLILPTVPRSCSDPSVRVTMSRGSPCSAAGKTHSRR